MMEKGKKLVKDNKLSVVILISLIVTGSVILTNLLSFSNIEKLIIEQLKENQLIKTEYAAFQIESHIFQVRDELVTLSKFPVMETLNINECTGDMRVVHKEIGGKIDSLLRVDHNGNVIECSSPFFSNYLGINIENKDYFKIPKESNEPFITGIVRQGTNPQIIISAPLFETTEYTPYPNFVGEFKGMLMSIIEVNNLYNLYIHPILNSRDSSFLLINPTTWETVLKSSNIEDYSEIRSYFSEDDDLNLVSNFDIYGKTIVTSSDLVIGSENLRLIIFTPLKSVIGEEINSVQKRHLFSLGFVFIIIIGMFIFLISLYKSKEEVQLKLEKTNVTLEKLGIKIEVEEDKYNQADISLASKKVYLIKEDDENHMYELFISSLNKGFAGLGVIRDDPRTIKKKYNLQKTSFIWLTKIKVEGIPCEANIDNLFKLISEFVKKSKKSVILVDRLDYILNENNFDDVIKKIYALKDLASTHNCIVILSVNPELIDDSVLKLIEAETVDLYGKHLLKGVELSDMEMSILKYVNEKNVNNLMVSYKDITEKFNITKPTTRTKISKLQKLGLLQINQIGRFKSLKITSIGRKIMG